MIDDLKNITKRAIDEQKLLDETKKEREEAERLLRNNTIASRIIKEIPDRTQEAAHNGINSIIVCRVGSLGYINSDVIPEYGAENWEILWKVEKYCKSIGFITQIKRNTAYTANYSYLEISW